MKNAAHFQGALEQYRRLCREIELLTAGHKAKAKHLQSTLCELRDDLAASISVLLPNAGKLTLVQARAWVQESLLNH